MTRYEVDLTDEEALQYLNGYPGAHQRVDIALRAAVEANRPKPAEPTWFGAMVEDRDGEPWVLSRLGAPFGWRNKAGRAKRYEDIDAVEVLR